MLIAITGGTSFIALRLAFALVRQVELRVRLLDLVSLEERLKLNSPCTHCLVAASRASATTTTATTVPLSYQEQMQAHSYPVCIHALSEEERSRIEFVRCDITIEQQVMEALNTVQLCVHAASYGMSGAEQMNGSRIHQVNVLGTQHVLDSCKSNHVSSLIYVSTSNVVFGSKPLHSTSESQPYFPLDQHVDSYSRTKSIAEQLCIAAANHSFRVIAIRPSAIYGDGEERHLPRILTLAQLGFACFAIGDAATRSDWVFCDNLTHALVLSQRLLSSWHRLSNSPLSEIYAISDDKAVNSFDFLSSLLRPLGYEHIFLFRVPFFIMYHLSYLFEQLHCVLLRISPSIAFAPFMTRAEVLKVGVTHYMNVSKAKRELGWRVLVQPEQGIQRSVEYYKFAHYARDGLRRKSLIKRLINALFICCLASASICTVYSCFI